MPLTLTPRTTHGRPTTDSPTPTPAPNDRGRSWLARAFAGDYALPAVVPAAVPPADRTPAEHHAVARALGCRDLFVIDAADRTARERIIADLTRAAAAAGERVLVLSPDPAAADRIAEAVGSDHSTRVVRALAAAENPYRPVPGATRFTSVAQGTGRVEHQRRDLAAAVAAAEQSLTPLSTAAGIAAELRAFAERFAASARERVVLTERRDNLDAELNDIPAFAASLAALRSEQDAETFRATRDRDETARTRKEKDAALATARQHLSEALAEVGKKPGFLSRLLHKPKHHGDPADLERQIADLERETADLAGREAKLTAELSALTARFAVAREELVGAELAARRADLAARIDALATERDEVVGRFALRGRELESLGFAPPKQPVAEAMDALAADVAERAREPERRLADARDCLADLNRAGPDLARRYLTEARAVVGVPDSLNADPVFEVLTDNPPFGLLILDHAEDLNDRDFADLSRLADRWVLIGDTHFAEPGTNGTTHRFPRNGRPAEPPLAARLARVLDREPWTLEGDRLVCRLLHLTPEQRRSAGREAVVDRPDVELRVTTNENGEAVLAEIAFPHTTAVAEAKEFLVRQVGEVLLRPCGDHRWHQEPDHVWACWPAADGNGTWVELGAGVREKVVGTGAAAFTAVVAFDRAAGWDEQAAAEWLEARLPAATTGRLAALPRPAHAPSPYRTVAVG